MKTLKAVFVAASVSVLVMSNAHAGGWIADNIIAPISPDLARSADQLNAQLGNPVDHAIAAGANTILPGSGTAMEGAWAIQRSGVLNALPQPQGFQPRPAIQPQQVAMGNFCMTQVGRFGPGPVNQIGAFCQAMTPWGVVPGTVGF
jgi:hypothetical protein